MKHRKITAKEVDIAREIAKIIVKYNINYVEILKNNSILINTEDSSHKLIIHNDILNSCITIEKTIVENEKKQEEDEENLILLELRGLTLDDIY